MTQYYEGYSTTPGSNSSAAPNGMPEGMAPSGVNDAGRQIMAAIAQMRDAYAAETRNSFVDPCCRIATRGNSSAKNVGTSYKYGNVDLVQCKATGTAVSAGTITQDIAGTVATAATAFSCKIAGATITGTGKVFFRRWIESADAISLKNKSVAFSVLVRHDVGTSINGFITVNKGGGVNDFSSPVTIAIQSASAIPTGTDTVVSALAVAMGDCSNGLEIILELDCGAVTTKNFYATDWQACATAAVRNCVVPYFEDDVVRALRYYETSYIYGTQEGTATAAGRIRFTAFAAVANGGGLGIFLRYRVEKVGGPTLTIYSPNTGATANVFDLTGAADIAISNGSSTASCHDLLNNSGGSTTANHALEYQFVADARL